MSVRYELRDHVARVTIDRAKVLNAIDTATERRLQDIWTELENEPEARVVVLTGTGDKAFCVGADLKSEKDAATGLEYWARPRPGGFGGIALRTEAKSRIRQDDDRITCLSGRRPISKNRDGIKMIRRRGRSR